MTKLDIDTLAYEQTKDMVLFVVRYERCRSDAGVPKASIPVSKHLAEDAAAMPWFLIDTALQAFVPLAAQAHPDNPEMWMPSQSAADYYIEIESDRDFPNSEEIEQQIFNSLGQQGYGFAQARDVILHDKPGGEQGSTT